MDKRWYQLADILVNYSTEIKARIRWSAGLPWRDRSSEGLALRHARAGACRGGEGHARPGFGWGIYPGANALPATGCAAPECDRAAGCGDGMRWVSAGKRVRNRDLKFRMDPSCLRTSLELGIGDWRLGIRDW